MAEPLKYSREIFESICDSIIRGNSLERACGEHDVAPKTFWYWRVNGGESDAERAWMCNTYFEARKLRSTLMGDEMLDIADSPTIDPADKRERNNTRKWIMSRYDQNLFGDKVQNQLVGSKEHDPIEQKITVEFVKPKITEEND